MDVRLLEATDDPEEVVCRAARNDYMREFNADMPFPEVMADVDGDGIEEKKRTLISHLLEHGHFGPFEHPQATFAIEGVSRSCMAQLTRHRHASFDVQSMRYVSFEDASPEPGEDVVAIPELDDPGVAGRNAAFADEAADLDDDAVLAEREATYREALEGSIVAYQRLLDLGVAPENARMVLPIGAKVNVVMSLNARMLMHVADMRAAADSQWEIRELTEEILDLAADWCPVTFEHYEAEMKGRKNRLAP